MSGRNLALAVGVGALLDAATLLPGQGVIVSRGWLVVIGGGLLAWWLLTPPRVDVTTGPRERPLELAIDDAPLYLRERPIMDGR